DPILATTVLAGTYRVWESPNSGGNWSAISGDLTAGGHLRALAVAPTDSNTIYSGSSDGQVYVTTNRGLNWTLRNTNLPANRVVSDLVVSPTDPLTVFASIDQSSGGRVFQTVDGGMNWQDKTGNLPAGLRGMSAAIDFNMGIGYVGTD